MVKTAARPQQVTEKGLYAMRLFEQLTHREEEILALVAHGRQNREIAATLNISAFTVQNHVRHLLAGLQVKNRTEASRLYWQKLNGAEI